MTAYIVLQLGWEYNDSWHDMDREVPLKAFLSRDDAEYHCLELELEAREGILRPSWYGGIERAATGLSLLEFCARVKAAGLPDYPAGGDDFEWEESLTPAQREWVWEQMDRVRFYEVAEVEIAP
jgi:hypothetical protein